MQAVTAPHGSDAGIPPTAPRPVSRLLRTAPALRTRNGSLGGPAAIQQPGEGVTCHQVAVPEGTRAWQAPPGWLVPAPHTPHKELHPHLSYFGTEGPVWRGSSGRCQPCILPGPTQEISSEISPLCSKGFSLYIRDAGWTRD